MPVVFDDRLLEPSPARSGVSVKTLLIVLSTVAICLIVLASILGAYLEGQFNNLAQGYKKCPPHLLHGHDGGKMVVTTPSTTMTTTTTTTDAR